MGEEHLEEKRKPRLDNYSFLEDYQDVFPEELPRFPPKRIFDFYIDLALGIELISKAPYQMTTTKLMEPKD